MAEKIKAHGLDCVECGKNLELECSSMFESVELAEEYARLNDWQEVDGGWMCDDCYESYALIGNARS